jgi:hypothetical protein
MNAIFERAAKAEKTGTSAACAALITELQRLEASERAAWESSAPPAKQIRHTNSGAAYSSGTPAGSRFAAAADAGDADACTRLVAEHEMLEHRRNRVDALRSGLVERQKLAAAEERLSAAPKRAKQLITALDKAIARTQAAAAEFQSARAELEHLNHELIETRKVGGDDTAALSLEQFRELGLQLSGRLHNAPFMFGSRDLATRFASQLLGPPPRGIIDAIRKKFANVTSLNFTSRAPISDSEIKNRLFLWRAEQVDLLAAGKIDDAKNLGAPHYPHGSRGVPSFGNADAA